MSSQKVTKVDLIEAVYEETRLEKKVIQVILESLLDEFKQALKEGSTIELRGFGTLEPRLRKGRIKARNPKTGEHLSVPPHYVAAFRSGRDLKTAMWNLPATKTGK
jgi:integration host factor subunit beta